MNKICFETQIPVGRWSDRQKGKAMKLTTEQINEIEYFGKANMVYEKERQKTFF